MNGSATLTRKALEKSKQKGVVKPQIQSHVHLAGCSQLKGCLENVCGVFVAVERFLKLRCFSGLRGVVLRPKAIGFKRAAKRQREIDGLHVSSFCGLLRDGVNLSACPVNSSLNYLKIGKTEKKADCLKQSEVTVGISVEKSFYFFNQNYGSCHFRVGRYVREIQCLEKILDFVQRKELCDSYVAGMKIRAEIYVETGGHTETGYSIKSSAGINNYRAKSEKIEAPDGMFYSFGVQDESGGVEILTEKQGVCLLKPNLAKSKRVAG